MLRGPHDLASWGAVAMKSVLGGTCGVVARFTTALPEESGLQAFRSLRWSDIHFDEVLDTTPRSGVDAHYDSLIFLKSALKWVTNQIFCASNPTGISEPCGSLRFTRAMGAEEYGLTHTWMPHDDLQTLACAHHSRAPCRRSDCWYDRSFRVHDLTATPNSIAYAHVRAHVWLMVIGRQIRPFCNRPSEICLRSLSPGCFTESRFAQAHGFGHDAAARMWACANVS